MSRILVMVIAAMCFNVSAAAAGQEEQNINYLARMADGRLHRAAEISGRLYGVIKKCPGLSPSESGKAMMAVSILLYHGRDRHLGPPGKFEKAIRVLEGAHRKAALSNVGCQAEKAKDPGLFR